MGLLIEMIDELGALDEKLSRLYEPVIPTYGHQRSLDLYRNEKAAIETRESGTLEEQASLWAEIANSQFELIDTLFRSSSNLSRYSATRTDYFPSHGCG